MEFINGTGVTDTGSEPELDAIDDEEVTAVTPSMSVE